MDARSFLHLGEIFKHFCSNSARDNGSLCEGKKKHASNTVPLLSAAKRGKLLVNWIYPYILLFFLPKIWI